MTRSPHVTLKSIANNAEIDVICERWQAVLEPPRATLNARLGRTSLRATRSGSEAGTAQAPDEATQEPSHALGRFALLAMTIPSRIK